MVVGSSALGYRIRDFRVPDFGLRLADFAVGMSIVRVWCLRR